MDIVVTIPKTETSNFEQEISDMQNNSSLVKKYKNDEQDCVELITTDFQENVEWRTAWIEDAYTEDVWGERKEFFTKNGGNVGIYWLATEEEK